MITSCLQQIRKINFLDAFLCELAKEQREILRVTQIAPEELLWVLDGGVLVVITVEQLLEFNVEAQQRRIENLPHGQNGLLRWRVPL